MSQNFLSNLYQTLSKPSRLPRAPRAERASGLTKGPGGNIQGLPIPLTLYPIHLTNNLVEVEGVPRMKTSRVMAVVALLVTSFATARAAETARGSYQFTLGDRLTKYVEFDAQKLADGTAAGKMFFSDESAIVDQDVDGAGDPE